MSAIDSQRFTALEQDWEVRFDFNAICEIEERTGEKFMVAAAPFLGLVDLGALDDEGGMLQIAQRVDFANLRQLLTWALEGAHPDVDLKTGGAIIQEVGLPRTVEVVAKAIAKALPTGGGDAGGTANPPQAKPKRRRKAAKAG
ncbi:hypothetical protein E3U23_11185 [Erythrobacter litoralis]|uniref:hypothetical protein n=1 Tax=Erythrobacter litoralis TaxID=39960 RepID=UPI002434C586|nr:hypothetical protein [Erythrobacter litoralis]MDG6079752.1 hypothetical protein [Erythrobacter litoralis]